MSRLGWHMRWVVGEGSGRSSPRHGVSSANGIVVVARRSTCSVSGLLRLATRTVSFTIQCGDSKELVPIGYVHGLHGESPVVRKDDSFDAQLEGLDDRAELMGGLAALGDYNRVPCSAWRVGEHKLTNDDIRLRDFANWECGCCSVGPRRSGSGGAEIVGGTGSEFCIEISSGELRAVKGDTAAKIGWTRFARKNTNL